MNIAVCVKLVPDPAAPGVLDPSTHRLDRTSKLVLDEADLYSIELALQLRDAQGDGEVVLVTMGPQDEGLSTGLAMGADKAIIVTDPALAGADSLTTAKVLAAAIATVDASLVITATESADGYTGTLPTQLAELLGRPSITFCKEVRLDGGTVHTQRQTEAGYDDIACPLPAVISVTAGIVEPRYPSFKGIMAAKNKPRERVTATDLGLAISHASVGQNIVDVRTADSRSAGELVEDDGNAHERIVNLLAELNVI